MSLNKQDHVLISVVVCTYNRSFLLNLCLKSLLAQDLNKDLFEIIVVNNNSSDNTTDLVNTLIGNNLKIRLIFENNQGISYSRNRGFLEAQGKYIAYIDDDAKANKNWLSEMFNFIKNNPDVKAFGGPYDRFFGSAQPDWFPDNYGKHILANKNFVINIKNGEWISGTNMVFNKKTLIYFNGFNVNFGPKGYKMSYGEETDLMLRLNKAGIKIYYVHSMMVKHLVADYKLKLSWLLKSNFSSGAAFAKINFNNNFFKIILAPLILLFLGGLKFLLIWHKPFKQKVYDYFHKFFFSFGKLLGYLGFL